MSLKHFPSLSILAVGAAVLGVAGCGGDKDGSTASTQAAQAPSVVATNATPSPTAKVVAAGADDPVALATSTTDRQAGGLAIALSGSVTAKGQAVPLSGHGTVDRKAQRGEFTLKTSLGAKPFTIEEITEKHLLYLRSEVFAGKLPGGRSWMKIDLDAAARDQGVNLDALGTSGPAQDPAQGLDYLRGAGKAKKLGSADIRGVPTTHYRVSVDLERAAKRSGEKAAKRAIDALIVSLSGKTTIPVDVWVDADNLIRRQHVGYVATVGGEASTFDVTTDYTKFGATVKATPPADSETIDGLKVLQQAAAAQKQAAAGQQG